MLCFDIQALAVKVKLDALVAISLVSSNSRTNGSLSGLVDDCRELLLQMPQVKVSHCFREANLCADMLAKWELLPLMVEHVLFPSPPPFCC